MRKNRKKFRIYMLILLFFGIGIGFASLNTSLRIDGTTDLRGNTWNVYIDSNSVEILDGSITGDQIIQAPTIEDNNKFVFQIKTVEPGEYLCFKFDIVNDGSLDAMVGNLDMSVTSSSNQNSYEFIWIDVSYISGASIMPNQLLSKHSRETFRLMVKYKEEKDLSPNQLPQEDQVITIAGTAQFVQADNTATSSNDYVYRYTSDELKDGDDMPFLLFSELDPYISNVSSTSRGNVAIKHIVDHKKILSSSLVFEKDGDHEFNPRNSESMISTLMEVFGEENCHVESIPLLQSSIDFYACQLPYSNIAALMSLDGKVMIMGEHPSSNLLEFENACQINYDSDNDVVTSVCGTMS